MMAFLKENVARVLRCGVMLNKNTRKYIYDMILSYCTAAVMTPVHVVWACPENGKFPLKRKDRINVTFFFFFFYNFVLF